MRVLIQRVTAAHVVVAGEVVGAIDAGLLLFLAVVKGDSRETLQRMVHKVANLRIFADEAGKMNRSLKDTGGQALVVSQFTLAGELNKGFRPSFANAEAPQQAKLFYELFCQLLDEAITPSANRSPHQPAVSRGRFAADMQVHLINDGPVTIWLELP